MKKGRPPTADESLWIAAREELTPQKSFAQIGTTAQFLMGSTVVFATVLTGVGIVKELKAPSEAARWIWLPAIFITISFIATVIAMTPRYATVALNDLNAVEKFFRERIQSGGLLIRVAGVSFALAIASTLIVAMALGPAVPRVKVTVQPSLTLSGDAKRTLNVTISLGGLPEGSKVVSEVTGSQADGTSKTILRHTAAAAAEGAVTATANVSELAYNRYTLTVTATKQGKELYRDTFKLDATQP